MTSDAWRAILDCAAKVSGVLAWVLQIVAGPAKHGVFLSAKSCNVKKIAKGNLN